MKRYAYFPGCSLAGTGREYAQSLAYVNRAIGLEFAELTDWNCCGASSAHNTSPELAMALAARNLALAAAQHPALALAAPCASCYIRLKQAALTTDMEIVSIMDVYNSPEARAALTAAITRPLAGLKLACYYGCLYTRPSFINGAEDVEDPQTLDKLAALSGAEPVPWAFKTECCGAGRHVDMPRESRPLLYRIYKNARACGAQAMVTACPMCQLNLDMRQKALNEAYGEDFDLPVYYISELLALALGAGFKEAGLTSHFHPAVRLLRGLEAFEGAV